METNAIHTIIGFAEVGVDTMNLNSFQCIRCERIDIHHLFTDKRIETEAYCCVVTLYFVI